MSTFRKITDKIHQGFTIIEVSLFLAITGLIFIGMIIGVNGALNQNHYDDDVRLLTDFIQSVYSKVTNVENDYRGRSNKAIYGKLITFGETLDLSMNSNSFGDVFVYDIVGNISVNDVGSAKEALLALDADVIVDNGLTIDFAGIADFYRARWGASLKSTKEAGNGNLKAALMIIRSPSTGTIFTYGLNGSTVEVNQNRYNHKKKALTQAVMDSFSFTDVDICVFTNNSGVYNGKMKDIRISANARSSSGVNAMPIDESGTVNKCN